MSFKIEVKGLDRVKTFFSKIRVNVAEETRLTLRSVLEKIRDDAKRMCPVDTGALQKSIRLETRMATGNVISKMGVSAGGYVVNPKTGRLVDYARAVEYGTSRTPAQPFLRPAVIMNQFEIRNALKRIGEKAMNRSLS